MEFNKRANAAADIIATMIIIGVILVVVFGLMFAYYKNAELKHNTYLEVVADLDEANRCLYQCGFTYHSPGYLENYKFCAEKCDRINERECSEDES